MTRYLDDVDPVGRGPAIRPEHGPGPKAPAEPTEALAEQIATLTRVVERLEARGRKR